MASMRKLLAPLLFLTSLSLGDPLLAAPIGQAANSTLVFTIDAATSAQTIVGGIGPHSVETMAFAPDGQLYGANSTILFRIDTATSAQTFIGNFGPHSIHTMAFAPDGQLYGANGTMLLRIDAATSAQTVVGSVGPNNIDAMAFSPIADVPEPATVVLLASAFLGTRVRRRLRQVRCES